MRLNGCLVEVLNAQSVGGLKVFSTSFGAFCLKWINYSRNTL
jgi:hypothetical protein